MTKIVFGKKIRKQLPKRGWTEELIKQLVLNPYHVKPTLDQRWMPDGSKNNDPATKYYRQDGNYVVVNDRTGDIVQVSNIFDPQWIDPSSNE
ncbi:colicin E5-related ribonuclease [Spirulina sp. CS-785/01]|uniref:colicin E5-related ribonuclease n=1 Tax=Spirulina sp. CS-785/01 TaxID=3021716 RepID=UPI00232EED3C|nr:colicin E5-related ribonuclease [Spirulina sp. CS-785/01]MDB9313402.1 colicin E5-related ribonuclease [Spirulina sp. CS-785/01]